MIQAARYSVTPEKKRVERLAVLANSREGESLESFKARIRDNPSTINGVKIEARDDYREQFIPRYKEKRWVVTLEEKHYA